MGFNQLRFRMEMLLVSLVNLALVAYEIYYYLLLWYIRPIMGEAVTLFKRFETITATASVII